APNLRCGLADSESEGLGAPEMPAALGDELQAIVLFQADPLRTHPDRKAWEDGLDRANFVVGFSDFMTEPLRDQANVGVPAEADPNLAQNPLPSTELETPPELPDGLRLGTAPSLWAGRETDHAPVLRFLAPHQRAELSAQDARRLGIAPGDQIEVAVNGTSV